MRSSITHLSIVVMLLWRFYLFPVRQVHRGLPPAQLQFGERVAISQPLLEGSYLVAIVVRNRSLRKNPRRIAKARFVNEVP